MKYEVTKWLITTVGRICTVLKCPKLRILNFILLTMDMKSF